MAGVDRPMMEAYLSELEQLKKMLKAARKIPGKAIASVMTADTFMKPLNFDSAATLLSLPLVNAANKSNAASTASGVRSTSSMTPDSIAAASKALFPAVDEQYLAAWLSLHRALRQALRLVRATSRLP